MSENIPPEISETPDIEIVIVKEGGVVTEYSKSYGIGIDCHSEFIQVSVQVKRNDRYYEYRHEFGTDWHSLFLSRDISLAHLIPVDSVLNRGTQKTEEHGLNCSHSYSGLFLSLFIYLVV